MLQLTIWAVTVRWLFIIIISFHFISQCTVKSIQANHTRSRIRNPNINFHFQKCPNSDNFSNFWINKFQIPDSTSPNTPNPIRRGNPKRSWFAVISIMLLWLLSRKRIENLRGNWWNFNKKAPKWWNCLFSLWSFGCIWNGQKSICGVGWMSLWSRIWCAIDLYNIRFEIVTRSL